MATLLAKKALCSDISSTCEDQFYQICARRCLERYLPDGGIERRIRPAVTRGSHILNYPTTIASLPVAVNMAVT
jgi:hypothetical protein